MNKIVLVGRLATDPELKYTPSGVALTDFRIAVDRPFKNSSGEREADFFTVKVWRDQAEHVANYLSKGRLVAVDGRLEHQNWVAQDGTKRERYEVIAERVEFLGSPRDNEGGDAGGGRSAGGGEPQPYGGGGARPAAAAQASASPAATDEPDFGDPFADQ
jgi:single-strand DNA-binding protein